MNEEERKESVMKLFQITRMISTLRTKFLQGAPCSSELADDIDCACSYIYSAFERVKDFEPEGAKDAKEAIAVRCPALKRATPNNPLILKERKKNDSR